MKNNSCLKKILKPILRFFRSNVALFPEIVAIAICTSNLYTERRLYLTTITDYFSFSLFLFFVYTL